MLTLTFPRRWWQARAVLAAASIPARYYGHHVSVRRGEAVDRNGFPIPWYTYPAISWLSQVDLSMLTVFEYGSGNSTRWWSDRARSVTAVEDDPEWHARIAPTLPRSTAYHLLADHDDYVNACSGAFDIVVIDGSHRLDCLGPALSSLNHGGAIVLDNSDWLPETARALRSAGLAQVDFIGPCPINPYVSATSVFLANGGTRLVHRDGLSVTGGVEQRLPCDWPGA